MTRKRGPGKPFEKGNAAGKGHGRPPVPVDIKQARSLNRIELERTLNKYLYMTLPELDVAWANPNTTALDRIVMGMVRQAITEGDVPRFNFLLERLIGKVKEPPQEHHHLNFNMMPRQEVIALGQEAIAFLQRMHAGKDGDE